MGFNEEWAQLRREAPRPGDTTAVLPATTALSRTLIDPVMAGRDKALGRLVDFRGRVVLVPLDDRDGLWTVELGALDWICAFSGEETLARFAAARGESGREWRYRGVVGARLLDEVIPALDFPCGIALDAAGPDGMVFPPMRGIVPDPSALDGGAAA